MIPNCLTSPAPDSPSLGFQKLPTFVSRAHLFQVVITFLANEKNHLDWPHVVCQDVQRHAYSLQGDLLVLLEQAKGKTLLPLPVGSENMGSEGSEIEAT